MKRSYALIAVLVMATCFPAKADESDSGAPATQEASPSKPGDQMPDETIYAGVSPGAGNPLYTTPDDVIGIRNWSESASYCTSLLAYGHQDWRMPTKDELSVLFNNSVENGGGIPGFNLTGIRPAGWYWSSTPFDGFNAWTQNFRTGRQHDYLDVYGEALRCVRG